MSSGYWNYSVLQGVDPNGTYRNLKIDYSGALTSVTTEHQKVHEKELWAGGYGALNVADAANIDILFRTPASYTVHIYIKCAAGGDAAFLMYEDITASADGTAITIQNHNRTETGSCDCEMYHTPTVTNFGTLIWSEYIPGGTGVATPGAIQTISSEQAVLKPSTNYVFRMTNLAGGAETMQMTFSYYKVFDYG